MFTGTAVQAVVRIGVIAVLARLLAPAEFGLATAAAVVTGFVELFAQLGVWGSLVQLRTVEARHVRTGATLSLVMGLIMAGVLFAAAPLVAAGLRMPALEPIIRVTCLVFPVSALGVVPTGLLARELGYRTINLINVAAYVFGYSLVAIAAAMSGLGVWALIFGTLALEVVKSALLLMARPQGLGFGWSASAARDLAFLGGGFTLAKFGNYLATQGDNVVVARMLGATAIGLYGRAYQLITMPATLIGQLLDDVLFSSFARIQDDDEASRRIFAQAVAFVAWSAIPLAVLMVILAEEIILTVFGGQWTGAIEPFRILATAVFLRIGYKMSDALTRGRGAVYRRAGVQWLYAGTVIVGVAIGQQWGLGGAAWAVVIALLLNYALMSWLSVRLLKLGWRRFFGLHRSGMALGILTALAALGLRHLTLGWEAPPVARLLLVAVPTGAACALAALLMPAVFLGKENRATLTTVTQRLLNRAGRRRRAAESSVEKATGA